MVVESFVTHVTSHDMLEKIQNFEIYQVSDLIEKLNLQGTYKGQLSDHAVVKITFVICDEVLLGHATTPCTSRGVGGAAGRGQCCT